MEPIAAASQLLKQLLAERGMSADTSGGESGIAAADQVGRQGAQAVERRGECEESGSSAAEPASLSVAVLQPDSVMGTSEVPLDTSSGSEGPPLDSHREEVRYRACVLCVFAHLSRAP